MADDNVHDAKPRNINRLILAALGGTLAVTIIVTIISVVLSPAHVSFSVTHASRNVSNDGRAIKLAFTVAASNPSRRCKVRYQSVFIDLKNSTSAAGKSSIRADILDAAALQTHYVEGPKVILINASVTLLARAYTAEASSFTKRLKDDSGFTAVVRALVRFKIGVARTRLFEMVVSCPGVLFPEEGSSAGAQGNFECSG